MQHYCEYLTNIRLWNEVCSMYYECKGSTNDEGLQLLNYDKNIGCVILYKMDMYILANNVSTHFWYTVIDLVVWKHK